MAYTSVKIAANASDYRPVMKAATVQMKELSSEYSVAATRAKLFGTATDTLKAKAESLNKKIKVQEQIVKLNSEEQGRLTDRLGKQRTEQERLRAQIEAVKRAFEGEKKATGENSDAAKILKGELDKLESEFRENETAIGRTENALTNQTAKVNQSKVKLMEMKAEIEEVNKELKNHKLNEFADACDKAGKKVEGFGKKMSVVSAGIAAFTASSAKMAVDFEDSIAKVSTIMDTSVMSAKEMKKDIVEMSNETGDAAVNVAENVYNAISAGQETGDAVDFVRASTKLATAGFAKSADTLNILSTILNAYGLEAEKVTEVSDMLVQTQNLGKTSVSELSTTMGKVIPTANANSVALDQLCTGYAIMTANGIATAESTTYINSMLNELSKTGSKTDVVLRERIGKSFGELMKSGKSLSEVLEIVADSARVQNLTLKDMFSSSEAGTAAVVLLGNGAKDYNNVLGQMRESTGSTDEAFRKMQTTSYDIKIALNELRNTAMEFGQTVMESSAPIVEDFTETIHSLCSWFDSLDEGEQQTILKLGLFTAAVGPAATGIGKFAQGISSTIKFGQDASGVIAKVIEKITAKTAAIAVGTTADTAATTAVVAHTAATTAATTVTSGMTVAQTALNLAMNLCPIIAIITGITALIAGGVALYKNWDTISEKALETWGNVKDSISKFSGAAVATVKQNLMNMKQEYEANGGGIKGVVAAGMEGIKGYYTAGLTFIDKLTGGKLSEIKRKFEESSIGQEAAKTFENVKETVSKYTGAAVETVEQNLSNMKQAYEESGGGVKGVVAAGMEGIKGYYTAGLTFIDKLTGGKLSGIKEKFSTRLTDLKETVAKKTGELKTEVEEKMKSVKSEFFEGWEERKQKVVSAIKQTTKTVRVEWGNSNNFIKSSNGITEKNTQSAWKSIKESVKKAVTEIRKSSKTEFTETEKNSSDAWSKIKMNINSRIENAKERVDKAVANIKEKLSFENLKNTVKEIWEGIKDEITNPIREAKKNVEEAIQKIKDIFDFEWSLPKLKLPHFKITGSFKLNPPSTPKFGVEWYRTGGIMTKPTAFGINGSNIMIGGEAGAEAILPLNQFYMKLEKILEGIIKEEDRKTSASVNIIMDVDSILYRLERIEERIKEMKITEIIQLQPDERKLFKIIKKVADIEKDTTGNPQFI